MEAKNLVNSVFFTAFTHLWIYLDEFHGQYDAPVPISITNNGQSYRIQQQLPVRSHLSCLSLAIGSMSPKARGKKPKKRRYYNIYKSSLTHSLLSLDLRDPVTTIFPARVKCMVDHWVSLSYGRFHLSSATSAGGFSVFLGKSAQSRRQSGSKTQSL